MQPIICPKCQTEVIPHETHRQRWEDCYQNIWEESKYAQLSEDSRIKIAMNLFNELNDFIISENIGKQKMETTRQIQTYKKANIASIKKEE